MTYRLICADVLDALKELPDDSVDCCVTSPPYFAVRDYGTGPSQIGLEGTPEEYLARLVDVFRQVHRVLKPEGTLWLNLGDSYAGSWGNQSRPEHAGKQRTKRAESIQNYDPYGDLQNRSHTGSWVKSHPTLKPKDLIGIPWRVAFALQEGGWWLRQWMPWIKRNGMPESIKDRPTSSCEVVFLLSKSEQYFYNHEAVQKPVKADTVDRYRRGRSDTHKWADGGPGNQTIAKSFAHMKQDGHGRRHAGFNEREFSQEPREMRARRNGDWALESLEGPLYPEEDGLPLAFFVNTTPFADAHFAVMPTKIVEPCVLAGCPEGGTVLDPFSGSGTVGVVSLLTHRNYVGIDLNPAYIEMSRKRLQTAASPLFGDEEVA